MARAMHVTLFSALPFYLKWPDPGAGIHVVHLRDCSSLQYMPSYSMKFDKQQADPDNPPMPSACPFTRRSPYLRQSSCLP